MRVFDLGRYRVGVDPRHGVLSLAHDRRGIRKARALVGYTVDGTSRELSLVGAARQGADGRGAVLELAAADSVLRALTRLTARAGDPALAMVCELSLVDADHHVRVQSIVLLDLHVRDTFLGMAPRDVLFRGEAYDGWTNAGNKRLDQPAEMWEFSTDTSYVGGGYFHRRTGAGIFGYHVLPHQWLDALRNDRGRLVISQQVDVPLRGLDALRSDLLLVNLAEPVTEALASMAAHQKPRRLPSEAAQHVGWNTWDYYTDKLTHESVMGDARTIRGIPWMRDRVRYIIIDGFWEALTGNWEPNAAKFPRGMAALAADIAQAGFVPGIWIAPFLADRHCDLLEAHPEYAVQYRGEPYSWYKLIGCGPPWGDRCYLDPTHPAVQEFVYRQMRKLHAWGYRYFKTDFLVDGFRPLLDVRERGYEAIDRSRFRLYNPDLGVARAHRACMQTIRAAIGEESFWLGCGTFIGSGAELMDASRICADIRPYWQAARRGAQSAIFSSHLHGNAYLIDPDFAVFRGPETMDPAQLDLPPGGLRPYDPNNIDSGPLFTEAEARQWATVTILCGGLVTLSDRIAAMNERGLAIIRTVLENAGGGLPIFQAALSLDCQ